MEDAPDAAPQHDERPPARKRPRRWDRTIALWIGGPLLALVALFALGVVVIDTTPGRALLVSFVNRAEPASGLGVYVGRVDGSIYGRMTIQDLRLRDPRGVFLTSPSITLDWRPTELLQKHVLLNEVSSPSIRLLRIPHLQPGAPPKPNQPTLPDLHLSLRRLDIRQLVLEPPVTGDRRSLAIEDSVELLHRRVTVHAVATAQPIDGHVGGDRLTLAIDAEPSANRLLIDAHLRAPKGGVVDRLAKLDAPLSFDLDGRGTWRAWNGQVLATLGAKPLLHARLSARSGLFRIQGQAQPALVVKSGPVQALTDPALRLDVSGRLQDRQLDLDARLGSSGFDLAAKGRLELARSRFVGVKVDARLLKPQAASSKLSGRDVRAALTLNGAFAHPVVNYDISAAELGVDKTLIENLHVAAKARIDADHTIHLPVHATASKVVGLPQAAGGLTTNLKVDGDLVITAKQIASDNLRIRSDRLDATLERFGSSVNQKAIPKSAEV